MKYYYAICLLLRHIAIVLVACQDTLPIPESRCENGTCSMDSHIQRDSPTGSCKDGVCITDNGILRTGQYLTDYIGPNATLVPADEYNRGVKSLRYGDIIIRGPEDKPKLRSAILDGLMYRDGQRFYRNIIDIRSGGGIGFVWVERPIPDPNTRFGNLSIDIMRAATPSGRHSWVDIAPLVPSSTKGRATPKCIPVSIGHIRSQ